MARPRVLLSLCRWFFFGGPVGRTAWILSLSHCIWLLQSLLSQVLSCIGAKAKPQTCLEPQELCLCCAVRQFEFCLNGQTKCCQRNFGLQETDMARQAKIALLGVLVSLTRVGEWIGPMMAVKFDCSALLVQATHGRARVKPSTCSDLSHSETSGTHLQSAIVVSMQLTHETWRTNHDKTTYKCMNRCKFGEF